LLCAIILWLREQREKEPVCRVVGRTALTE
jgi:hypothetical protein